MTWTPAAQQPEVWSAKAKQAETWGPATIQSETWVSEDPGRRVFSPLVFSHAFYTGLRVFAIGSSAGVWDYPSIQSEVWTAA